MPKTFDRVVTARLTEGTARTVHSTKSTFKGAVWSASNKNERAINCTIVKWNYGTRKNAHAQGAGWFKAISPKGTIAESKGLEGSWCVVPGGHGLGISPRGKGVSGVDRHYRSDVRGVIHKRRMEGLINNQAPRGSGKKEKDFIGVTRRAQAVKVRRPQGNAPPADRTTPTF